MMNFLPEIICIIAFRIGKKTENDCFIISCHTNAFLHQKKNQSKNGRYKKVRALPYFYQRVIIRLVRFYTGCIVFFPNDNTQPNTKLSSFKKKNRTDVKMYLFSFSEFFFIWCCDCHIALFPLYMRRR